MKNKFNKVVKGILAEDNLKVNVSKTENTTYERENKSEEYTCTQTDGINLCITKYDLENWRTVKKLGSLLGDYEDIACKKETVVDCCTI